jgi:uncharacterized protein YvpB
MEKESSPTRDMLTNAPQLRPEPTAQPPLLWILGLVGVAAIIAAALFIYVQTRPGGSVPPALPGLMVNARATREAHEAALEAYQGANELLRAEVVELRGELARTQNELAQAQALLRPTQQASVSLDRAPLALILDVPLLTQERSLSCESSAAAMAAQYQGLPLQERDILDALPRHENPHYGFRGNVDGPDGGLMDYGVYAEPIGQVLSSAGLKVEPFQGGIPEIKAHIRQGRPVLAWITYGLQVQTPQQWMLADSQGRTEAVTLVPYEHTVLIVGYNREGLWVHDPLQGTRDFYSESEFWRSFGYLGYMALVIGPPASD